MEQVKSALKNLEQAVFKLENAVYAAQRSKQGSAAQVQELKQVIKTAYARLDAAIAQVKQGGA
ncbi:MAG: hypothetical protein PHX68_03565 [Alphaproteobacteria bacterium]|nr:hypothetical protein [Alphaproteobacteria bacterium]